MLRDHGSNKKYFHEIFGHNYRMEAIQGAVLGIKLKYLESWTEKRRAAAKKYYELLSDIEEIILPKEMEYAKHVYHLFVIQSPGRDDLQKKLNEKEIGTGLHYPLPLHLQKCFQYLGYSKGDFTETEKLATNCLSLPMFPEITEEQLAYISNTVREFYKAKILS